MQLMRRNEIRSPLREMENLSTRLNRLFEDLSMWPDRDEESLALGEWAPGCDIVESDKEYRVTAELPNVKKEDVHVTFDDGVLTIQGERRDEREEKGAKYHRRELSYGTFLRRFAMPADVDSAKVDATFKDGMLNVVIPKTKVRTTNAREIAVH